MELDPEFEDMFGEEEDPNPIGPFQQWMDVLEELVSMGLNEELINIDPGCEGPYWEWYNNGKSPQEFFAQFFVEHPSVIQEK